MCNPTDLRTQRRLRILVTTYLTDMSVHRVLVHPGVDLHLAWHELPAAQAVRLGAGTTRVVQSHFLLNPCPPARRAPKMTAGAGWVFRPTDGWC